MNSAFLAVPIAGLIVFALTPLVSMLAFRLGAVSQPGGRHVHDRAIPRLGGLAIAAAVCATLALLPRLSPALAAAFAPHSTRLLGLVGGGLAMCALGAADDTRGVRAVYKLVAQIGVAIFAFECGFRIDAIYLPFAGDLPMGVFAMPITLLWIVGVVNAVNLIDGLDGLAAGVVLFAAGTNLFVAYRSGAVFVVVLSAATAGAALGFLFHNFNPARIFMGDSGSYFLGYTLAVTALLSQKASTAVSLLVPMVALGVPIVDTLFAMVRRFLERRPIFSPDRGHIHHRLLDMGVTHRRAVLIIYGFCVACTIVALGIWFERSWEFAGAMLCALAVLVGLVRFVGHFGTSLTRSRQKERLRSRDTEFIRYALPRVPEHFALAGDEAELFEALEGFAKDADLGFVEVIERGEGTPVVHRWTRPDASSQRDMVTARYPIGRDSSSRADLKFGWISDEGEVSPQSEILLQVAADMVEKNLVRLRSRLAPAVPAEPEVERSGEQLVPAAASMRRTG